MITEFAKYKEPEIGDWIIIKPNKNKWSSKILDYIENCIFEIINIRNTVEKNTNGVSVRYTIDMESGIGDVERPTLVPPVAPVYRNEIVYFGKKKDVLKRMALLKTINKYDL